MMATSMSQKSICSLVKVGTLKLKSKAGSKPVYNGVVVAEDILLVTDFNEWNLHLYSLNNGRLLSSHRLESSPHGVCLISKTKVAVCLSYSIEILSFKSIDDVTRVKTLNVSTGFRWCHSVAKWNSYNLLVSGWNYNGMFCWRVVSIRNGRLDSTHDICKGIGDTHMAIKDNTVYISCQTSDSITEGVYAYDILNPHTHKFVYQHEKLTPWSIMADRNSVFVCNLYFNRIHQLTDSGQLVTIHTLSSRLHEIFYDGQHGVLYTTMEDSNVITLYKMEYLHQPDSAIPAEVLKMDTRSLQMYKEALNEGKEKVYSIRVMVVGQYGVGKTTLTQRLLGKNVNISKRNSTDGIDVNVECCKVSLPAGEWTTQEKNAEQYSRLQRLVKLLNERAQKQEFSSKQERQSKLKHQVTREKHPNGLPQHDQPVSKEHNIGHPQHDQPVSAEPDTNLEVKPPSSQPAKSSIVRMSPKASSGIKSKEKDTVMKILQLVNTNSGKLDKSTMEYAALALWDFAGQYVFYTTHQTFLTSRAVYLLVIDLSQQVTDLIKDDECFLDTEGIKLCKVHELIEIWLNSIHSCTPSSHSGIPPVILVGTHVDKIPKKFRKRIIDEYFMKIREMLKNKPVLLHLMDNIAIDNTQCDPRLEDLKRRIFQLASQQPHWGEEKPARWLPLEQAIMTLKASGVKVAPLTLIVEINRSASVKIEDRNELEVFLNFQHEIGTILYFSADGLRDKIILDPQWMIDALKSLITAQMFIMQNPAITEKWFAFKEKGKLTHELIDAIWTKQDKPDFHDNKEHILCVMEKLNIIARPMSYSKDGNLIKEEGCYLAPCMLREATPKEVISPKSDSKRESTTVLCFVSKGKFLPPPVFHRLIGACLTHWPIAKQKSKYLIYCGCCVFDLDHHHRLTLHFFGHVIYARVTRQGVKDISQCSELCTEARKFIFENLSLITGNLGQSLQFEPHIQCPDCGVDSLEGLIAVTTLQKYEEVVCHSHDESHTLMSQQLLKFWYEDEGQDVVEGTEAGKGSKISEKRELASTSIATGKLHRTVLNQCLPKLMTDLDVRGVMMYIQQKELFNDVTVRDFWDILEQKTSSHAISKLIQLIQQRDQYTYEQFKECLVLARQADLKVMLEEVEAKHAPEVEGKYQGAGNTGIQNKILPQVLDMRAKMKSFPSQLYQSRGVPCFDPDVLCQILIKSQQAAPSSQSTLEVNCLSVGLELLGKTPSDGNCFFEAVSSQLRRLNFAVLKSPQQLRQEVVAFMKTNRVLHASEGTIHLESFIYNESFDDYCTRMARDGEWADHVVVVAMARMLQIDIMIVTSSPSSGPEGMIVWVVGETVFQGDPILLGHIWESHYQSLQPIASSIPEVTKRPKTAVAPATTAQLTTFSKAEFSKTAASTTMAKTTQKPNIQTSTTKPSISASLERKGIARAAPTALAQKTRSPKVQTSTTRSSITPTSMLKAVGTRVQTYESSNVNTSRSKTSKTAKSTKKH